jgi:Protein of unknown function (DUF1501)
MRLEDTLKHSAVQRATRRFFLKETLGGLAAALYGLNGLGASSALADSVVFDPRQPLLPRPSHFAPKAKRVIFLHMAGAPSQLDLFEYKPELKKLDGQDCPQSFLEGKRFAFIRGVPKLMGPVFPFEQVGQAGFWLSDRLPHIKKVVDKVCFLRAMHTEQFNHSPAQLLVHTGNQNLGHGSIGSWITYGLGSENQNLPGFVVLLSGGKFPSGGKSLWGSGFLPGVYQGVQCRSQGDPVLFLSNPPGINRSLRGEMIKAIGHIDERTYQEFGDPQTVTRIAQYEMAFRMQLAATDAVDISQEPKHIHDLYGTHPGEEHFSNNCLLARRLIERGVRYVQLFDWGWDSHGSAPSEALNVGFRDKCRDVDQATAALLVDLEQRGLLDETLVIWGAEFGRTPMRENRGGKTMPYLGRDHNPGAYTIWLAGGGVKQGFSYGQTDPFGYTTIAEATEVRDFHATLLHLMGIDHKRLTYMYRGLDEKLTGVKEARVIHEILA